jgi:hypothetical protein
MKCKPYKLQIKAKLSKTWQMNIVGCVAVGNWKEM